MAALEDAKNVLTDGVVVVEVAGVLEVASRESDVLVVCQLAQSGWVVPPGVLGEGDWVDERLVRLL